MHSFTFSGHETFALRISWLPKAVAALEDGLDPFTDATKGMEVLGLGKNMVRSLAFWVVASGLAKKTTDGLQLTELAKVSLSRKSGHDPFLENPATLWLIHWHLCNGWVEANGQRRYPFAWYFFGNLLASDEICGTEALTYFRSNPDATGKSLSEVTLKQHFEIFIKTYVHSRFSSKRATPEDALDSPLTSLGLIRRGGDRRLANGKRDEAFRINYAAKDTLSLEVFRFCLHDWWKSSHQSEETASMQEIALGGGCIGKVSCLPELEVHRLTKELVNQFPTEFALNESSSQRTVQRLKVPKTSTLLQDIYI